MKIPISLAVVVGALLVAGCGGGSSVADSNPQPATTAVQVNLGDDPADRLLAVNVTIDSFAFRSASGDMVPVLPAAVNMEMMHLQGTVRPLAMTRLPQGTYSAATMTLAAATVTFVDPATGQLVQRTMPGPMTAQVNFAPHLSVGTAPMVVNVDMDMSRSVTIDGNGVSMAPSLSAHWRSAAAGSSDPEAGGFGHMTGVLGSVNGASLTMTMLQGLASPSLMTHAGTEFVGVGGMGSMHAGTLVAVDGSLQADGTWLAHRVRSLMAAPGAMAMGVVADMTGSPPTQLTLAVHDGAGLGMSPTHMAATSTVELGSTTQFEFESYGVDLGALAFTPRFDGASLRKGQRVAAFSSSARHGGGMHGMMGGSTLTASKVQLVQQALRGTVSGYTSNDSRASFTLTMPADSAFAVLSGTRDVIVYQQPGTRTVNLQSVANGFTPIVRGLLFYDAGTFRLVASRIVGAQ